MSQGVIWILSFSVIVFAVLLFFGIILPANGLAMIIAGVIFLIFGLGVATPSFLNIYKRKKREHDLRTGKIKPRERRIYPRARSVYMRNNVDEEQQ